MEKERYPGIQSKNEGGGPSCYAVRGCYRFGHSGKSQGASCRTPFALCGPWERGQSPTTPHPIPGTEWEDPILPIGHNSSGMHYHFQKYSIISKVSVPQEKRFTVKYTNPSLEVGVTFRSNLLATSCYVVSSSQTQNAQPCGHSTDSCLLDVSNFTSHLRNPSSKSRAEVSSHFTAGEMEAQRGKRNSSGAVETNPSRARRRKSLSINRLYH